MINFLKKQYQFLLNKTYTKNIYTIQNVIYDLLLGLRFWRIWYILGIKDIKLRYKRSKIGQVWHTLTTAIQVTFMGIIWAYLFKMPVAEFFPYLAISKIIYEYISSIITNGSKYYYTEKNTLLEMPSPKSIYAYANSFKAFISFLHNFIVIVAVVIIFKIPINFNTLYFLPALLLLLINSVWVTIFIGYLGARFRDIPPLIDSVIGIIVMITPIMWKVDQLPAYTHKYMILNPFNIFIKINRDALLGLPADLKYWGAAIILTICGYILVILGLKKYLYRITFWV